MVPDVSLPSLPRSDLRRLRGAAAGYALAGYALALAVALVAGPAVLVAWGGAGLHAAVRVTLGVVAVGYLGFLAVLYWDAIAWW
jgi:hypothetical protein